MNICSNCGAEYDGEFCPNCGVSRSQEKICPHCGALVKRDVNFCNYCGHALSKANTANGNGNRGGYAKLAKILPCVYIFALLLFSALLWAFYSAPILDFLGVKLDVYTVLTKNVDELEPVSKSLIIVGAISVAYSLIVVGSALIGKTSNVKIGKIYLPTLLSLIGNVLYLTVFVIACAMTTEVNKNGLSAGSCCGLLISFSLIFALATVFAFVLDCRLMRVNGEYSEARIKCHKPSNNNVTKTTVKSERKERVKKERKARIKQEPAEEIALSAVAPDKKLKRQVSAFLQWNKCVWLAEFIGVVALMNYWTILMDVLSGFTSREETLIYTLLNHGDALAKAALIAVLVLCAVAFALIIVIAVTTPRLLKTSKPTNRNKKLTRVYLISEVTFIVFAALLVATLILFATSQGGVAFVGFSLITLIPCFGSLVNFIRGIHINKIFRFKHSKKSANEAVPTADLDAFCDGCVAYYNYKKQQQSEKRNNSK